MHLGGIQSRSVLSVPKNWGRKYFVLADCYHAIFKCRWVTQHGNECKWQMLVSKSYRHVTSGCLTRPFSFLETVPIGSQNVEFYCGVAWNTRQKNPFAFFDSWIVVAQYHITDSAWPCLVTSSDRRAPYTDIPVHMPVPHPSSNYAHRSLPPKNYVTDFGWRLPLI